MSPRSSQRRSPRGQINLGLLYTRKGDAKKAEEHYRQALKLQPSFAPAYVSLADLYRLQQRDRDSEKCCAKRWRSCRTTPACPHSVCCWSARKKSVKL
jgi:Tfp pilus assembly protein PilF